MPVISQGIGQNLPVSAPKAVGLEEGGLAGAVGMIRGQKVADHLSLLDDGDLNPGQRRSGTVSERFDPREFNPAW